MISMISFESLPNSCINYKAVLLCQFSKSSYICFIHSRFLCVGNQFNLPHIMKYSHNSTTLNQTGWDRARTMKLPTYNYSMRKSGGIIKVVASRLNLSSRIFYGMSWMEIGWKCSRFSRLSTSFSSQRLKFEIRKKDKA